MCLLCLCLSLKKSRHMFKLRQSRIFMIVFFFFFFFFFFTKTVLLSKRYGLQTSYLDN